MSVHAEAEAAQSSRPISITPYQEGLWRLAALIPHPFRAGRYGCDSCGLDEPAKIHHWEAS